MESRGMDTTLLEDPGFSQPADESLMKALGPFDPLENERAYFTIGVENSHGTVYRLLRTTSFNEAVRIFESAKDTGFIVAPGRRERKASCHRILRRPPGRPENNAAISREPPTSPRLESDLPT